MKLLFCPRCNDVFKLMVGEIRRCACKATGGKYLENGWHAVYYGEGTPLDLDDHWLYAQDKPNSNVGPLKVYPQSERFQRLDGPEEVTEASVLPRDPSQAESLRPREEVVMRAYMRPGRHTQLQVAQLADISQSSVSRAVQVLVKRGFLAQGCVGDDPIPCYTPTKKAHEVFK